jgi:hypothetical protein
MQRGNARQARLLLLVAWLSAAPQQKRQGDDDYRECAGPERIAADKMRLSVRGCDRRGGRDNWGGMGAGVKQEFARDQKKDSDRYDDA